VGAHGVAMLQAWVQPTTQTWLADSLTTLKDWKARQICLLQGLGWVCLPSHANFFCALPGSLKLESDSQRLRRWGIKLRDTASFGLPGHVRLAVKSPRSQDALKHAWEDLMLQSPTNNPSQVLP
jgi:histidinol-phosphate aminotransferase